jgi:hypothetical protein
MSAFTKKILGAAYLPIFISNKANKKKNECHGAEHDAENLERIFAESGGMMDQHELMELMMNRNKASL